MGEARLGDKGLPDEPFDIVSTEPWFTQPAALRG